MEETEKILNLIKNHVNDSNQFLDQHPGITIFEMGEYSYKKRVELLDKLKGLDKEIKDPQNREFLCKTYNYFLSDNDIIITSADYDVTRGVLNKKMDPVLQKKVNEIKLDIFKDEHSAKDYINRWDQMLKKNVDPEGLGKDCPVFDTTYMTPNNKNLPNLTVPNKLLRG